MRSSKISTLAAGTVLLLAAGLLSGCGEEPEEAVSQSEGMAIAPMPSEETLGEPIAAIEDTDDFSIDGLEGMEDLEGLEEMDTIDGTDSIGDLDESEPFADMLESMSETVDEGVDATVETTSQVADAVSDGVEGDIDSTQDVADEMQAEAQTTTLPTVEEAQAPVLDDDATEVVTVTPEIIRGVQQALVDAGFNPGPMDGISGPRTLAALESFQQQNNLAAGQFTKETLRALGVDY